MWLRSLTNKVTMIAVAGIGFLPANAEAGPLIDWLFGRQTAPAYPVGPPVAVGNSYGAGYGGYGYNSGYAPAPQFNQPATVAPVPQPNTNWNPAYSNNTGYAANYGTYYGSQLPVIGPAGAGYTPPQPTGVAAANMPSPTLSYVPNFQTQSYRAPVTYYRPLMTTDPNTGSQVVAMAPCTSYECLAQRQQVLGRSALYGSNNLPAIVPAPQSLPTYTLPSGGIPLAYTNNYNSNPYTSGYRGYSALQPQAGLPVPGALPGTAPMGSYQTTPMGSSPYYGGPASGGCNGSYPSNTYSAAPQTVPGLVAPQAPGVTRTPAPTWGQITTPPDGMGSPSPNSASPVYPPSGGVSPDPADSAPSIPQGYPTRGDAQASNFKPQMRAIPRTPVEDSPSLNRSFPSNSSSQSVSTQEGARGDYSTPPSMAPIPVPDGFDAQPRWNPGLLRENDLTALRPIAHNDAQLAGQAKRIHWASFEEAHVTAKPDISIEREQTYGQLRAIQPQVSTSQTVRPTETPRSYQTPPASNRYDSSGWKAKR